MALQRRSLVWALAATAAITAPAVIAYNVPPSATFLNQAAAFVGWGVMLFVLTAAIPSSRMPRDPGLLALLGTFFGLLGAAMGSALWSELPWSLALSSAGTLGAAMLVALVAAAVTEAGMGVAAFHAFCTGLLVAGLLSSAIGVAQVYLPPTTDGDWIARSAIAGRAVGNLRQPNHLSSLLLWSIVASVWLGEPGRTLPMGRLSELKLKLARQALSTSASVFMLFAIVLSGSRTGALGTATLAAWGLLDRRLSRFARTALVLSPVAYAVLWLVATEWAHSTHQVFGGETRFSGAGDVSSSRFAIWSNTMALIKAHPWLGVGFGEFNFAWTLTPFPGRPVAFFDHTHNLLLQFAVELGLPLTAVISGLLGWALFAATRNAVTAGRGFDSGSPPPVQRAALVMVLMVAVHSLLEYPLWYAYFLLPAAFAFGLCLSSHPLRKHDEIDSIAIEQSDGAARDRLRDRPNVGQPTRPLVLAAMSLMAGGALALYDYTRVVVIFSPPPGAASLQQRIEAGRRSVLFAHHADYAAATTDEPGRDMSPFKRAPHYLLDARLMMAWAEALAATGEIDRARYVAARLREFRNEQAESFFAPCAQAAEARTELPFQCQPPLGSYTYEDFR